MKLKFEKESNGDWYVILPDWEGTKDDLQMVLGADTMLDIVSNNDKTVELNIELEMFDNSTQLELLKECEEYMGGGDYILKTYENKELNLNIWLCDVTKFIFGFMPQKIYFKRIT